MSNAYAALGTKLAVGSGSPVTYAPIAKVKALKLSGFVQDVADVTTQDSLGWKEALPTLRDGGTIDFDLIFDPKEATQDYSGTSGVLEIFSNQTSSTPFQIQFPTTISPAVTWSFTAIVVKFATDFSETGVITAACSLKITGKPTLA